jgi:hypothetical protein
VRRDSWQHHTDTTLRVKAEGGCECLEFRAGRLEVLDFDALSCTGLILLDGRRFPVRRMTLEIVAGQPLKVSAEFDAFEDALGELPAALQRAWDERERNRGAGGAGAGPGGAAAPDV